MSGRTSSRRPRSRTSPSYGAKLQRRMVATAPRRQPAATPWRPPAWLRAPWRLAPAWLVVGLALAAEAGHLAAAFVEWPASAARGGYHVLAGAAFGLAAVAIHFGPRRIGFPAGAIMATSGPLLWLGGALLGASPYMRLPGTAAGAVAVVEVALAANLYRAWRPQIPAWVSPKVAVIMARIRANHPRS